MRCLPLRTFLVLALTALAVALPAAPAAAKPCAHQNVVPTQETFDEARSAVRCLLNKERKRAGRRTLRRATSLERAADRYAANMVRHDFFGHVTPSGRTLVQRIKDAAASYVSNARSYVLGENLAWGSGDRATPRQTVIAWMNSEGHRRNILDRRFVHLGVGIAEGAPADTAGQAAATYTTEFGSRTTVKSSRKRR